MWTIAERRGADAEFGDGSLSLALLAVIVLAVVADVMLHRAGPILKGRVIETLSTRFKSRVELDQLQVSVLRGLEVSGDGLRIFPPDDVVAAGATKPLISLAHFSFHCAAVTGCLSSRCMWARCM